MTANEDSLPAAFFFTKKAGFLYKNEISPLNMVFEGAGAGQHYLVGFLSLLSPQARGARNT